MEEEINIKLRPSHCLEILNFLRQSINNNNRDNAKFQTIHEALNEFQRELFDNATADQLDYGMHEIEINMLIGRSHNDSEGINIDRVRYRLGETDIEFKLKHNLGRFGMSLDKVYYQWWMGTNSFTAESLRDFIRLINAEMICEIEE